MVCPTVLTKWQWFVNPRDGVGMIYVFTGSCRNEMGQGTGFEAKLLVPGADF